MKAEHRMGKGEFSYLRDWAAVDDDEPAPAPADPSAAVIRALLADEVRAQVEKQLAAVQRAAPPAATTAPARYRIKVQRGADHLITDLVMEPVK